MQISASKKIVLLIVDFSLTFIFLAPNLWMLFGAFKNQNAMFALPPVWIPDFTYIKNFTIVVYIVIKQLKLIQKSQKYIIKDL